jgi:hypothetical protein
MTRLSCHPSKGREVLDDELRRGGGERNLRDVDTHATTPPVMNQNRLVSHVSQPSVPFRVQAENAKRGSELDWASVPE